MRKRIFLGTLLILLMLPVLFIVASAHSGRTDGNGGHTDHDTGEYHYHHGYPAHEHLDMDGDGDLDCPYKFDDQTDHSPVSSNKQEEQKSERSSYISEYLPNILAAVLVIGIWLVPMFFGKK